MNWAMLVSLGVLVAGLAALALALAPNVRPAPSGAADDGQLSLDQRMIRIADRLQCPICEGQSVAFSNSQLAEEMRRLILEKLQAGESEAQIMQYFIDRYGIKILREPPKRGLNAWLWITPIAGVVVGLFGLVWKLRQMAAAQQRVQAETAAADGPTPLVDPDVQDLLAQYDKDLFA